MGHARTRVGSRTNTDWVTREHALGHTRTDATRTLAHERVARHVVLAARPAHCSRHERRVESHITIPGRRSDVRHRAPRTLTQRGHRTCPKPPAPPRLPPCERQPHCARALLRTPPTVRTLAASGGEWNGRRKPAPPRRGSGLAALRLPFADGGVSCFRYATTRTRGAAAAEQHRPWIQLPRCTEVVPAVTSPAAHAHRGASLDGPTRADVLSCQFLNGQ